MKQHCQSCRTDVIGGHPHCPRCGFGDLVEVFEPLQGARDPQPDPPPQKPAKRGR